MTTAIPTQTLENELAQWCASVLHFQNPVIRNHKSVSAFDPKRFMEDLEVGEMDFSETVEVWYTHNNQPRCMVFGLDREHNKFISWM